MKVLDDEVKTLLTGLIRKPVKYIGRYPCWGVFWIDGDVAKAKSWVAQEKLTFPFAVVSSKAEMLKAWKLDPKAKTTFVAANGYRVDGVFVDPTLDGFAAALKKAVDPRTGLAAVRKRMSDEKVPLDARRHAVVVLRSHGARAADAVPDLVVLTKHLSWTMRNAALGTLALIATKEQAAQVEKVLLDGLQDTEPLVRMEALHAIRQFPHRTYATLPAVRKLFEDPDKRVRKYAKRTLERILPEPKPAKADR